MLNETFPSMDISVLSELKIIMDEMFKLRLELNNNKERLNDMKNELREKDKKIKVIHNLFKELNKAMTHTDNLGHTFKDIGLNNLLTTILIRLHNVETQTNLIN